MAILKEVLRYLFLCHKFLQFYLVTSTNLFYCKYIHLFMLTYSFILILCYFIEETFFFLKFSSSFVLRKVETISRFLFLIIIGNF